MITRLTLRNFKNVRLQTYDFTQFDLLVGRNNSGKSTVLQALAIWQFCIDEFRRAKRTSSAKGVQVILPNFTALPVPEFILLWKDQTDRVAILQKDGKKKPRILLIEMNVEWKDTNGETKQFAIELRYQSAQTIYARPKLGWDAYQAIGENFPKIAYVPPFSGLEPQEKWLDVSPIRQQIGKGQPGSVLRNLLLRVKKEDPKAWQELSDIVARWFGVKILPPEYESDRDIFIAVHYQQPPSHKKFDIIAGGSGFHQTLTLLAFLYGYQPDTILLDEPDAHLHVNLQREILSFFKRKSTERQTQFLIATHANAFIEGVNVSDILSLLGQKPTRVASTPAVLQAMSEVSNQEITSLLSCPVILYVEGEDDERILRAWAEACDMANAMRLVYFKTMHGGDKKTMRDAAEQHFKALRQIVPDAKRLMLFDYDDSDKAFHPPADNPSLFEWKRKNIENYLLVTDVWLRTAAEKLGHDQATSLITEFFADENLTRPAHKNWREISANIFSMVDGKKLLFSNEKNPDATLFEQLKSRFTGLNLNRETVAQRMTADELHEDVHQFFAKLRELLPAELLTQLSNTSQTPDPQNANQLGNLAVQAQYVDKNYDLAEKLYRQAIEADPNDAEWLARFAVFMDDICKDYDQAESLYRRAIAADDKDARNLGNCAVFMQTIRKDYDQAESLYRRTIAADPTHAHHLGNFAWFMHYIRKDYDQAESLYRQAIAADPNHALNLGNFAAFMQIIRQDYDQAESLYQRAIAADPNHAGILGNFAWFMHYIRKDYDQAESLYRRAIAADEKHANNLGNFANFMKDIRKDYDQVESLYQRAIAADLNHADILGRFAIFLHVYRKDYAQAQTLYLRALELAPNDANLMGNLAQLYLQAGDLVQGRAWLDKAFATPSDHQGLLLELWLYRYAHFPAEYPQAVGEIQALLDSGARSVDWDFSGNLAQAKGQHPDFAQLQALVTAINTPV
jgi:tetratricopeptide (TPR) repeat protein/ABC-type cobalamin/Fe3+-siderophores transport system ATPase subunit